MKNKSLIATICFIVAALLLLKFFGLSLAVIISGLLPFILVICGIIGILNGKKVVGSILLVIGILWCLSFLSKWFLLLIAAGLIYIGVTAFRKNKRFY